MRRFQKGVVLALIFAASLSITKKSFASNCIPDSTTTFKAVTDYVGRDHLYWVDTNSLHVCTWNTINASLTDLTSSLNLPLAGSPIVSVVDVPTTSNDVYLFYVDGNSHIQQVVEDFQVTDLTNTYALLTASPWTSIGVVYNSTYNFVSVAYAHDVDTSSDKYGVRKRVRRFDYFFSSGAHSDTDLYSTIGHSNEHLETQVNIVDDGSGRVYSTFDPEGQGHVHYIANNPGLSNAYNHQDLMDDVSLGHMNVTTGGGIVSPNNPTCQASGVSPLTSNGAHLVVFGADGDYHELYGANTNWQKRDINHESSAPLGDGCGKFHAIENGTSINLLYETVISGGRGLIRATLAPSAAWSYDLPIGPGGTTCQVNVLQKSPLAITSTSTGSNHFYYVDVNGHVYRDCAVIFN
jgi:hypothetical protein